MARDRFNTTIRLLPAERAEIEAKMKEFGFTQLSPFIRFALKQLGNVRRKVA
jgi:hypothetical protein